MFISFLEIPKVFKTFSDDVGITGNSNIEIFLKDSKEVYKIVFILFASVFFKAHG